MMFCNLRPHKSTETLVGAVKLTEQLGKQGSVVPCAASQSATENRSRTSGCSAAAGVPDAKEALRTHVSSGHRATGFFCSAAPANTPHATWDIILVLPHHCN